MNATITISRMAPTKGGALTFYVDGRRHEVLIKKGERPPAIRDRVAAAMRRLAPDVTVKLAGAR